MKKLIPYSVYLPVEYHDKIKELAKQRKASSMVRDAICMIVDGDDTFKSGYNKALKDCIKEIDTIKEIEHIAVRGKYLADVLADQIKELGMDNEDKAVEAFRDSLRSARKNRDSQEVH